MTFEFATSGRIVFGNGTREEVAPLAAGLGRKALVVTGSNPKRLADLIGQIEGAGVETVQYPVSGEPTVDVALKGVNMAVASHCDLVIGIGGGSVLDTAKAVAALATNRRDPFDYLEVIGRGQLLTEKPLPVIAVPTTAGTGSEVARNAVLASPEHRVKVSLRSPLMLPVVAVVDPELTYSMPPEVTASTGLDALTQVLEPFVSFKANPLTDGLCREGLKRAARSLERAFDDGGDTSAREDMAVVSLFGGLALTNAGLGAVHGFAGPIGGMFPAPHGIICARLLPHVMEANVRALSKREPDSPSLARYDEVGRILTGTNTATAADGVKRVHEICAHLGVPPLSTFGVREEEYPAIVEKAQKAGSMKANPIRLTNEELMDILYAEAAG
jgi:alcohol dehydrogenase class IV